MRTTKIVRFGVARYGGFVAVGCDGPKGVGPDRQAEVEVGGWVPAGHGTHGADALAQGNFTKET